MPGEVVVELGPHAVARLGGRGRQSLVVAAPLGMFGERVAVAAHAERGRCAGDDDRPHVRVGIELGHDGAVLGVHPPRPRVVPVGTMEPHRATRSAIS